MSSPKMLRRGTTPTRDADVLDHGIAEHQRLAFAVLLETLRDPLDGLAEVPVEVAHGIVQAFLDLVLDVALDPVGVVRWRAWP